MVNAKETVFSDGSAAMTSDDPERALVLAYAPAAGRPGLAALLALDDALAKVLRSTSEPMLGQMRLTWWHDALCKLDTQPAPAEPVLCGLAELVLPHGVTGAALARMVEGWEELLEETIDDAALERFAVARGETLFVAGGQVLGATGDPLAQAGRGWALADLSWHMSDVAAAGLARALAGPPLATATATRWSRNGRALGALAHLARLDMAGETRTHGAPGRVWRVLWHRMTGR
jgi:phytoene synthase